ncbi:MAG: hypothetical protein MUE86_02720 [Thiobacillaceae bacterium]|nr:hypothetical protein [Thiobacillaceae bacterium]
MTESIELIDKDEHIEQASRALKAMSHPLHYRVGDTRTLQLIGMMRDVFCAFAK